MKRLVAVLFVALVGLIGNESAAQGVTTIRVASNANDDVTPLLYAQHAGWFDRAGIHVEIEKMNSGAAVTAAVIGGSIDIGKSSLLPLISAHGRGLPVVLVAPGELWLSAAPVSVLVADKNVQISNAKDLAGKTVAVYALRDVSEIALRNWIDANGGDSKTVKVVEVPAAATLAALTEGRIDAANLSDPALATVLASGKAYIAAKVNDAISKEFLLTGWFATKAYVAANSVAVARFVEIMQRAAQYTNTHHAETVALTAPFWGIDPNVLAHMTRATIGSSLDPKQIQPLIDVAAKYGVVRAPFNASELIAALPAEGSH